MHKKKSFTKAEKRIVVGARRRVTKLEKLLNPKRFSLGGEYFVSASVKKITSHTAFLTVSRVTDFLLGVSHGKATAERKAGERAYRGSLPAATEAQAKAQSRKKATPESRMKRKAKAKRHARKQKAASKAGFERGKNQRREVYKFVEEMMSQHDRYLVTGHGRLVDDDYRRAVHLAYEYNFDEERIERMKESFQRFAVAA